MQQTIETTEDKLQKLQIIENMINKTEEILDKISVNMIPIDDIIKKSENLKLDDITKLTDFKFHLEKFLNILPKQHTTEQSTGLVINDNPDKTNLIAKVKLWIKETDLRIELIKSLIERKKHIKNDDFMDFIQLIILVTSFGLHFLSKLMLFYIVVFMIIISKKIIKFINNNKIIVQSFNSFIIFIDLFYLN